MKLGNYISELLFQYDCVIVPDLGGFVANYKSATIQPIQNNFYPPSKGISFNKNLNSNDGLLVNFIVQKEGLTYATAYQKMEEVVTGINRELKAKKKVLLQEVGTLFLDSEQRIQFEPAATVNYLLDSYGLPIFSKQPIKRVTLEDKITKEFKDRTAPLIASKTGTTIPKKWLVAAAITIPLAFFAIWIPTQYNLTGTINTANLNPFKSAIKSVYTPPPTIISIKEIDETTITEQLALADTNTNFIAISFDATISPFVVKLKDQPTEAEAVSTYVETANKELHYHIVGGCFANKNNAKKLVKQLINDGFNASIIGKRKGLWTVSYNSFATKKEAMEVLATAKAHNTKAWILNL